MRFNMDVTGIAGCGFLATTDARHQFLSETLEDAEDVMLESAKLHPDLIKEPFGGHKTMRSVDSTAA